MGSNVRSGFLVCAAMSPAALASGPGFSPAIGGILLVFVPAVIGGLLAGAWTGWRQWPWGRALLAGGALALIILMAVFLRREFRFFALVAVPWLLGAFLVCQALTHGLFRWRRRRVVPRAHASAANAEEPGGLR